MRREFGRPLIASDQFRCRRPGLRRGLGPGGFRGLRESFRPCDSYRARLGSAWRLGCRGDLESGSRLGLGIRSAWFLISRLASFFVGEKFVARIPAADTTDAITLISRAARNFSPDRKLRSKEPAGTPGVQNQLQLG